MRIYMNFLGKIVVLMLKILGSTAINDRKVIAKVIEIIALNILYLYLKSLWSHTLFLAYGQIYTF